MSLTLIIVLVSIIGVIAIVSAIAIPMMFMRKSDSDIDNPNYKKHKKGKYSNKGDK